MLALHGEPSWSYPYLKMIPPVGLGWLSGDRSGPRRVRKVGQADRKVRLHRRVTIESAHHFFQEDAPERLAQIVASAVAND